MWGGGGTQGRGSQLATQDCVHVWALSNNDDVGCDNDFPDSPDSPDLPDFFDFPESNGISKAARGRGT